MSLKNYKVRERQVQLSDGTSLAVRGLSLANISEICQVHAAEVQELFSKFVGRAETLTVLDASSVSNELLRISPVVVAHIIAAGTGDSTAIDEAASLPVGLQLEILSAVGEETFKTSGGAKNVLEIVIKILKSSNGFLGQLNQTKA